VLIMPLAAGKYVITAQATIEGTADGTAVCRARAPGVVGPGWQGTARSRIGPGAGATQADTLTMTFGAAPVDPGSVHLRCWEENGTGANPTATASNIVAVRIGNLTNS
ncbi:MAG: hypothetical protein ACRDKU_00340, partial [Gaiellaceae bacterium]